MADELIEGFKRFREEEYTGEGALMPQLVRRGQYPEYFIIGCIDSRAQPGTIFRAQPGKFFGFKAMGAIVRLHKKGTALSAALQFALDYNKVRRIILLGHTGCGAIRALAEKLDDEEISSFIDVAQEGLERAKARCGPHCSHEDLLRHAEEQILLQSAENLRTYPSVARALAENRLEITPWIFDMEKGALLEYCADQDSFLPISEIEVDLPRHKTSHNHSGESCC